MPTLHVLMEKPFTTDVDHAAALIAADQAAQDAAAASAAAAFAASAASTAAGAKGGVANAAAAPRERLFLVNHSANSRKQCQLAAEAVASGAIGKVCNYFG